MRVIVCFLFLTFYATVVGQPQKIMGTIQQYNQNTHAPTADPSWPDIEPAGLQEYKAHPISVKKFDKKKWKGIVGHTNYSEKKIEEQETPRAKQPNPWISNVLRIVVYILLSVFILFIIYYVIKNTSFNFKKSVVSTTTAEEPIENIEELNIDDLLQQAIRNSDFRLAVRLYYLGLLKNLHQRNIISWKKDKTNRDYLTEIFTKEYYNELRILTLAYEQVWYGERPLSEELFKKIAADFRQLDQQLTTTA